MGKFLDEVIKFILDWLGEEILGGVGDFLELFLDKEVDIFEVLEGDGVGDDPGFLAEVAVDFGL